MENKYILEIDGHSQDGHIILDTSEGLRFHAEFREEQDAKEYIEFKNRKKIDKSIKENLYYYIQEIINKRLEINLASEQTKIKWHDALEIIKNLAEGE